MKIREIHISEGVLGNMVKGAARAIGNRLPAGVQQYAADRRARRDAKTLSDAAWQQWTNRVAQISRSQGVRSATDIPEQDYANYLRDFVESTFLRYDLSRYDQGTQDRIEREITNITQARGSAGQVRRLFHNLGTQALAALQTSRSARDFRDLNPDQQKVAQAVATAIQPQPAAQPAAVAAQPTTQQAVGANWVDMGQGVFIKPATATSPTIASIRKNIFSLTDQGQWLDANDRPAKQTVQAYLNQALERL